MLLWRPLPQSCSWTLFHDGLFLCAAYASDQGWLLTSLLTPLTLSTSQDREWIGHSLPSTSSRNHSVVSYQKYFAHQANVVSHVMNHASGRWRLGKLLARFGTFIFLPSVCGFIIYTAFPAGTPFPNIRAYCTFHEPAQWWYPAKCAGFSTTVSMAVQSSWESQSLGT